MDGEKIDMEQENLKLQLEVTRQRLLIVDLEEQVREEKTMVQQIRDAKLQDEAYLAFQDEVIEELEAKVQENTNNKDVAQVKIKELEVLIQKLIRFLVATISVIFAIASVLTYMYVKP